MRINRYLARSGVASRRNAENFVLDGRVRVNGVLVTNLATEIGEGDEVTLDNQPVSLLKEKKLLVYHKPRGVLVSHWDPHGERLIYDDLPKDEGLFSIGRLDKDSEGLLLVTNDGDLAQRIAHPSAETEKEYVVFLHRPLEENDRLHLEKGVFFQGEMYHPDRIRPYHLNPSDRDIFPDWPPSPSERRLWKVVLHEGKKREIRRMFEALGYQVKRLLRVRIGKIRLQDLSPGEYTLWEGDSI